MKSFGTVCVCILGCLAALAVPNPATADDKTPMPAFVRATCKGHTAEVAGVAFSPDGKQLATASLDRSVRLWESTDGKPVRTLTGHQDLVLAVAYRGDGKQLASGSSDKTARIWDTATGKELFVLKHPNLVDAVAFNPAGDQLATAGHDGVLRFWDVAKGTQVREIKAHTTANLTAIYCLAWSKDGKQIATGGLDQSVKLWDATGAKLVREFKAFKVKEFEQGHRESVWAVTLSPDGKHLASAGSDRMVKIWTIADGKLVRDLTDPKLTPAAPPKDVLVPVLAHSGWIYAARFTPDGLRLVTGAAAHARNGSLAIWTVSDGKLEKAYDLPTGPIHSLDITGDGRFIALACGPTARGSDDSLAFVIEMPHTTTVQAPSKAKP